jgi:crotonyl-CoA carboxylase/reductase
MSPDIHPIDHPPPLGTVPARMYAQVIREERFGDPLHAFRIEEVDVPAIGPDECLVLVMAAGIHYNGIWATRGIPINLVELHRKHGDGGPFHIHGSDGSGIVYAVGPDVTGVRIGDEVVMHSGSWDVRCPEVRAGIDPTLTPTFRAWGYETNYGSFAQFTRVKAAQLLPKPAHLSWEAAASYMANAAAAYRALHGFPEHAVKPGQIVLIWGGAGGLGSQAIQLCRAAGAIPIAVVSSDSKAEFCLSLGARGVVDRTRFDHWGPLPPWDDAAAYGRWLAGAKAFREAIWEAVGARRNPQIVFEHPGEATLPTSCFVAQPADRVRAPRRGDAAHLVLRVRRRRDDHHLRGDHRVQRDARSAPPLDAPEALPGHPLREPPADPGDPRARLRARARSLPRAHGHLRRGPARAPAPPRDPRPARPHGRARLGAGARPRGYRRSAAPPGVKITIR